MAGLPTGPMSTESPKPLAPPATRQDLILEAMLTVGEIRKPGYVQKVLDQLLAQDSVIVAELRPSAAADHESDVRTAAVAWLRQASLRARARAAHRQRLRREMKKPRP